MTIVHMLVTDRLSGAEQVALSTLRLFKDTDKVFYVSKDGPIREEAKDAGIEYIPADTIKPSVIKRICKALKPDIIHAHDPRMCVMCALAGIDYIAELHADCKWMRRRGLRSTVLYFALRKARRIICVSHSIKDEYVYSDKLSEKISVIDNCIDRDRILSLAGVTIQKKYDIIFVGRLSWEKRPLDFVRLVAHLLTDMPDIKACVVGDGNMAENCKKEAKRLGADLAIDFLGFCENPYSLMAKSRIGVVTSEVEGFGLAAVEEMTLGLPVAAYPVGGLCSIVTEKSGKLCRSIDEMSDEIKRLISGKDYYDKKSAGASERAARFSDMDNYERLIRDVYGI